MKSPVAVLRFCCHQFCYWCHLLITFANSLDLDQVGQNVQRGLDPNRLKQLETNICSVIKDNLVYKANGLSTTPQRLLMAVLATCTYASLTSLPSF